MSQEGLFALALAESLASSDGHVRVLRQELVTIRGIVKRNYPDAFDILSRIDIVLSDTAVKTGADYDQ